MINITISAETVAWYAAIVATITLLFDGLNYIRDRSNVVVTYNKDWKVFNGGSRYNADKTYMAVRIVNKGRRPVTIGRVGYMPLDNKDKKVIFGDSILSISKMWSVW